MIKWMKLSSIIPILYLVIIVFEFWDNIFHTLPLSRVHYDLVGRGPLHKWIARHVLPVGELHLRERLSSGILPQVFGEAEGLFDRQEGLDLRHGCPDAVFNL